ncbi:PP2C family protein-serine/threonine phosphatase [Pacificibacter marinus]|uniref:Transcriptional regulatory protein AfsQ1 n=1 Tax=Pacificibacter marinus TaxID=658057 RepID=A0A1Y5T4K0_9RHOB|nr:fused response regulator/phosphatase [Pacificibacter marinus]SEL03019.1 Serine phosphatase RsbU, regulator of sigma subunit [Pacificibacter marinus]SLN52197.1 Transcriptional regulatory protein AfsQ1 [Pacificibacter marinus]
MAIIAFQKHLDLQAASERGVVSTVLVVDDSCAQRRILSSYLGRWGYTVFEAESGEEALEVCALEKIDLIVSDWMMPGISGLDFCRIFRTLDREDYGYFILLTSKSDKAEVAQGLDVGADDFLTKPVSGDELLARIRAGERILKMQRELTAKNDLVSSTLKEISALYGSLDRDLVEARKLQQSLVKERFRDFGMAQASLLLRPSGHVGGDLVGFFPINDDKFGVFSIDVSGHGVASALMTARLAAYLTGSTPDQNLAITQGADGVHTAKSPSEVAKILNTLMLDEMETDLYFTMILGYFDQKSGTFTMSQCGHPFPALQRKNGSVEAFGDGGFPVGLIPNAEFEDFEIQIAEGERIVLLSDGVTECPDGDGGMLGENGFMTLVENISHLTGSAFFDTMLWYLNNLNDDKDFPDDISAILLEYPGQGAH